MLLPQRVRWCSSVGLFCLALLSAACTAAPLVAPTPTSRQRRMNWR